MNAIVKGLSLSKMQSVSGGNPQEWKVARILASKIIGNLIEDPERAANSYHRRNKMPTKCGTNNEMVFLVWISTAMKVKSKADNEITLMFQRSCQKQVN